MSSLSSTTPVDNGLKKQKKPIPRAQTIITWILIGLWFVLISFGVISAIEPVWLQKLSRTGIDVEARTYKDFGDTSMYKHDFKAAISQYKKALSIKPDFVDALVNLAVGYSYAGRWQSAEKLLKDSLNLVDTQTGVIHYNIGLLYERLGRTAGAIDYYQRALGSEMEQWVLYRRLARMYMTLGREEEAVEALKTALSIQIDPASGYRDMLYHSLCIYEEDEEHKSYIKELLPRKNRDEALSHFDLEIIKEVNRHNQEIAKTHHALGLVYSQTGNQELAIHHYREALKIRPDNKKIQKDLQSLMSIRKNKQKQE